MSRFIGSEPDRGAALALDDIERHVAWLYATAVRTRKRAPTNAQQVRLVRQILAETEAFSTLLERLNVTDLDSDAALDVAGILTRALDQWRVALKRWRHEACDRALAVSAAQLVEVAERMLDALTSAAWVPEERTCQRGTAPRTWKAH